MRRAIALLIFGLTAHVNATDFSLQIEADTLRAMSTLEVDQRLPLRVAVTSPADSGTRHERDIAASFKRLELYAPDARVLIADGDRFTEVPRDNRLHLVATDGVRDRIGLSLDPESGVAEGIWLHAGQSYSLGGTRADDGSLTLGARSALQDENGADLAPECAGSPLTAEALPALNLPDLRGINPTAVQVANRQITVVVDTDNELMLAKFSNNNATATAYIAALFTALNVIYSDELAQFGLKLQLNIGTTILRPSTTPDPYTGGSGASQAQLVEFGNWWQANQAGVSRAFAMLLSGKSSNPNSASGIAWVLSNGTYCSATGGTGGHYSVNQIFTNTGFPASSDAYLVGHELGHNLGARHTHCANAATGAAASTNTIDRCFNGESGSGCYAGTQACPTAIESPTAPMGSLMSYCHLNGLGCGVSNEIHPTHVTQLNNRLNSQPASCVSAIGGGPEQIFRNGFE